MEYNTINTGRLLCKTKLWLFVQRQELKKRDRENIRSNGSISSSTNNLEHTYNVIYTYIKCNLKHCLPGGKNEGGAPGSPVFGP